jgi:hypothetical protein
MDGRADALSHATEIGTPRVKDRGLHESAALPQACSRIVDLFNVAGRQIGWQIVKRQRAHISMPVASAGDALFLEKFASSA